LAVRSKLLVDSVDAYVLRMPSPVNKKRRYLFAGGQDTAECLATSKDKGLEPLLDRLQSRPLEVEEVGALCADLVVTRMIERAPVP
jgi:hypothetical protein